MHVLIVLIGFTCKNEIARTVNLALIVAIVLLNMISSAVVQKVHYHSYSDQPCQKYSYCNMTDEIVRAIFADEESYQRLIEI